MHMALAQDLDQGKNFIACNSELGSSAGNLLKFLDNDRNDMNESNHQQSNPSGIKLSGIQTPSTDGHILIP